MKVIFIFLALWFTGAATPNLDIKHKALGKWSVTVVDAPEEFKHYIVDIKKVGESLKADIKGGDANLKDQVLTVKDDVLTASVFVGEYVDLRIWEEKSVLTGTAQTSFGKLKMVFKKVPKGK